jgi:hypothetical protein
VKLLPRIAISIFIAAFLYAELFVVAAACFLNLSNTLVCVEANKHAPVYLHVAVPFMPVALNVSLPEPIFLLFNGGGVFNAAATFNLEMQIRAQLKGTSADGRWITLRGWEDYFPCASRGERWERLTFDWHKTLGAQLGILPNDAERSAYEALSEKFKKRWNTDHPDTPVERIAIYMDAWPRGDESYYQLFSKKQNILVYRDAVVK